MVIKYTPLVLSSEEMNAENHWVGLGRNGKSRGKREGRSAALQTRDAKAKGGRSNGEDALWTRSVALACSHCDPLELISLHPTLITAWC